MQMSPTYTSSEYDNFSSKSWIKMNVHTAHTIIAISTMGPTEKLHMALREHAIPSDPCVVNGVLKLVILSDDMQLTVQICVL